jgi:cell wall-associated NlpC family hydrolase
MSIKHLKRIIGTTLVAAVAGLPGTLAGASVPVSGQQIVEYARTFEGKIRYQYGMSSERVMDCSAFTGRVYQKFGMKLPRSAADQYRATRRIPMSQARPGDLVFWRNGSGGRVGHVGIWVKEGRVIDASSSKRTVVERKP